MPGPRDLGTAVPGTISSVVLVLAGATRARPITSGPTRCPGVRPLLRSSDASPGHLLGATTAAIDRRGGATRTRLPAGDRAATRLVRPLRRIVGLARRPLVAAHAGRTTSPPATFARPAPHLPARRPTARHDDRMVPTARRTTVSHLPSCWRSSAVGGPNADLPPGRDGSTGPLGPRTGSTTAQGPPVGSPDPHPHGDPRRPPAPVAVGALATGVGRHQRWWGAWRSVLGGSVATIPRPVVHCCSLRSATSSR